MILGFVAVLQLRLLIISLLKTNKEQTEHINSINGRNRLNINEVVIDINSTIGNDMVVVDIK